MKRKCPSFFRKGPRSMDGCQVGKFTSGGRNQTSDPHAQTSRPCPLGYRWVLKEELKRLRTSCSVKSSAEKIMIIALVKCPSLCLEMRTTAADFHEAGTAPLAKGFVGVRSHNIQERTCSQLEKRGR